MPKLGDGDLDDKFETSPAGYTEGLHAPPGVDVGFVDDIQAMQGEIGWDTSQATGQVVEAAKHEFNDHYRLVAIAGYVEQLQNDVVEVADIGTLECSIQTINSIGWNSDHAGFDTPGQFHEDSLITSPAVIDTTNGAGAGLAQSNDRETFFILPELHLPHCPSTIVPGTTHHCFSELSQAVSTGISLGPAGCGVQFDVFYYLEQIEEEDVDYSQHYRY